MDDSLTPHVRPRPTHHASVHIAEGGLDDARVIALLRTHLTRARAETAPGSAHALDLSGLRAPDVTFWSAWLDASGGEAGAPGDRAGATLAGVGALKRLAADHGEVKSMYADEALRGRGIGSAILRRIVAEARGRGMTRLSLETGAWPYFAPARAMYARHGFVECAPFGDYRADPNSVFMTLDLAAADAGAPAGPPSP
jgi:putative acetyltransferase